ncbi:P-loop containing nucleoside triphosphate hydrolase protein [Fimicolochytrium jonesii]|uniref:P-loop containing nucleoside triphosphate hydrolase protein n=1 Tax=Fimicolochytrium jonesii TaxID=1396493 RepID=UPI0022FE394C|nr:P-loop containing nucleoside triphosphate hydrolase protein [Fimicolochytrium jonesii]KAI8819982.1 P-loop containing nucleoside triphosphate hydrolase protein [Fimicolochytrium jonesii]
MLGMRKKVVCVGDEKVGKSASLLVYCGKPYPESYQSTVSDTYQPPATCPYDELWDTPGTQEFDRLRPYSYDGVDSFFVFFAIDDPLSFENVEEKWIPEVRYFSADVPITLVGCKQDLRNDPSTLRRLARQQLTPVSFEKALDMSRRIGAERYIECSARLNTGITSVFEGDSPRAAASDAGPSEHHEQGLIHLQPHPDAVNLNQDSFALHDPTPRPASPNSSGSSHPLDLPPPPHLPPHPLRPLTTSHSHSNLGPRVNHEHQQSRKDRNRTSVSSGKSISSISSATTSTSFATSFNTSTTATTMQKSAAAAADGGTKLVSEIDVHVSKGDVPSELSEREGGEKLVVGDGETGGESIPMVDRSEKAGRNDAEQPATPVARPSEPEAVVPDSFKTSIELAPMTRHEAVSVKGTSLPTPPTVNTTPKHAQERQTGCKCTIL